MITPWNVCVVVAEVARIARSAQEGSLVAAPAGTVGAHQRDAESYDDADTNTTKHRRSLSGRRVVGALPDVGLRSRS